MMSRPLLSIIVIAYNMPRQALNTLRSLASDYQEGVSAEDYEVVLVENRSRHCMDSEAIAALPGNFRYFLRDEPGVSPAAAINFGFAQARAEHICLMIDGARMVTPGLVHFALMAFRAAPNALVVTPSYHLGEHDQQHHLTHGYSEESEQALLASVNWPEQGYRLFEIGCWSAANPKGYFQPFMECNCLCMPAAIFRELGQADERFACLGGGMLNLDIYRRAALHRDTRLFVLAGEGSFHQLHGGVTTSETDRRDEILRLQQEEYSRIHPEPFRSPAIEPVILGAFKWPGSAAFLQYSVELGSVRYQRLSAMCKPLYADDECEAAVRPVD